MKTPVSVFLAGALITVLTFATSARAVTSDDDYINADRPGLADGSTVVGKGRLQIETGIQTEYHSDPRGHDRRLFVPSLIRLGLDDRWELRVEGNTYSRKTTTPSGMASTQTDGVSPTSLGVKYHFLDSAGLNQPSLAVIARVFPPSGSSEFKTAHTTGDFRLVADWDFTEHWSLNPNFGVGEYEDDAGRAYTAGIFATTLNYNPSKVLNFFVDTGIQTPEAKGGRTSAIVDVGAAYIIGHDVQVDFSLGTRAAGITAPRPFISAGISKRF